MARLLFTVSGGLEGLAEDEVRRLLPLQDGGVDQQDAGSGASIKWRTRGHSGSQLEVHFSPDVAGLTDFVLAAMSKLRFVEYVYLQLLSTTINASKDGMLDRIQQASSKLSMTKLHTCLQIGRQCQDMLQDKDIGLEKLPGLLLPTPEVDVALIKSTPIPLSQSTERGFVVNTVYTRDEVANVVVEEFVKLVCDTFTHTQSSKDDILWVDAGTGSGALLRHLPFDISVGIDTHPTCSSNPNNILEANFLQMTAHELQQFHINRGGNVYKDLCIISNPPFAERSRGDFSAIVKFINKAVELGALCVGLIVPVKFARERIWASLGMDKRAKLLARFLLPNNAFYDPSSGKGKHISSVFLLFGLLQVDDEDSATHGQKDALDTDDKSSSNTIYIVGKQDKGSFPWISTADFSGSVARGLEEAGADLSSEKEAKFMLSAQIKGGDAGANAVTELALLLNPKRSLSLTNSMSRLVSEHSLGWISNSAKPPIAYAMCRLAVGDDIKGTMQATSVSKCGLAINAMSGEGTIELEAQSSSLSDHFFMVSGDKDYSAAVETGRRLESLKTKTGKRPKVDTIVWDAQRLPLRKGIADAYLADLPFAGSKKKAHQAPTSLGVALNASLDYKFAMGQALMTLKPGARAVLLSADAKAMGFASRNFNWTERWQSSSVNVGGLSAKLSVMERGSHCWKDLSIYVRQDSGDMSQTLLLIARHACAHFTISSSLELQEGATSTGDNNLVDCVELHDIYFNKENVKSHGYRFFFNDTISNGQAKILYKLICTAVEANPAEGMLPQR